MADETTQPSVAQISTSPQSAAQTNAALAGQETPKPNVALARGAKPITVNGSINIGTHTIKVGSEEEQRAGFYTEYPEVLLAQYPDTYKRALRMGRSAQTPVITPVIPVTTGDSVDRLNEAARNTPEFQAQNGGDSNGG